MLQEKQQSMKYHSIHQQALILCNTLGFHYCSFSQPLSVAASTANGHAVNRGQLDAIIQQHSDTYTQGLQNRITALEESKMEIIGKGRYWNTAGNFYPKVMPTTGTTFPVFDTSAGQADYENLHNISNDFQGPVSKKFPKITEALKFIESSYV